jgi:hypothetical protein
MNWELTESVGALVGCLEGDCVGGVDGCDVGFSVVGSGVISTNTIWAEGMREGFSDWADGVTDGFSDGYDTGSADGRLDIWFGAGWRLGQ